MTDLLLVFLVFVWGINYSVIKDALHHFLPLAFNGLRFVIASLVLLVILGSRGRKLPSFGRDWPKVLFVGLIGNAVYQVVFIYGIHWTKAGNTSLILASTPVLVALFSVLLGHETVTRRMWTGIFASFFGVVMLVLGSTQAVGVSTSSLHGDFTVLFAAVLWSIYIVFSAPLVQRYGAIATSAATLWVGAPLLLCVSIPSLWMQPWGTVQLKDWGALLFSAVLAIAGGQIIWYRAIGERGNARTSVYSNLVPLIAVFIAWPLLGEVPGWPQMAGAAAILAGAFLTRNERNIRSSLQDMRE